MCCTYNFYKILALFGVNYFSPEIMVVLDLGHLEGLHLIVPVFIIPEHQCYNRDRIYEMEIDFVHYKKNMILNHLSTFEKGHQN